MSTKTLSRSRLQWKQIKTQAIAFLFRGIPLSVGVKLRRLTYPAIFAKLGSSVKIDRDVYFKNAQDIEIGKEAVICENVELLVEPGTQLKIGDRVFIERDNRIIVSEKNSYLEILVISCNLLFKGILWKIKKGKILSLNTSRLLTI